MDKLTTFFISMVALSVGVERIVEIVKGLSKKLRDDPAPETDPDGNAAARRRLALQAIATLAGAITALTIGPHDFFPSIPEAKYSSPVRWISALTLGLMASGGSAFWNHTLDIVGAIKSVKEQIANPKASASVDRITAQPRP